MKAVKTHEIVTWGGRSWPLTKDEYDFINSRLEAGARFLTMPDADLSKVAATDVRFFGKRQMTMGDMIDESKGLPQGKIKEPDPLAAGYIKFLAMSIKLKLHKHAGVADVVARLTDEQKPLVNAELKKQGVSFQV